MAFVSPLVMPSSRPRRLSVCTQRSTAYCFTRRAVRMSEQTPASEEESEKERESASQQQIQNDAPVKGRRLVRNISDLSQESSGSESEEQPFAAPRAGEAGGPEVGKGLGPRRGTQKEKRVTKASAAQGSMSFADAWASQNRDRGGTRFDFWFWVGLLFILTPAVILVVALYTGVIPGLAPVYIE